MHSGYKITPELGLDVFAFFPLFPYLWQFSSLSATGVIYLNSVLLLMGLLFMVESGKIVLKATCLYLFLPLLAVFLIPYAEATFFATVSIAIFGHLTGRKSLCFSGLFLASMARPGILFVALALFIVLVIDLMGVYRFNKPRSKIIKQLLMKYLPLGAPLVLGVFTVFLIQAFSSDGHLLSWWEAQKAWSHTGYLGDSSERLVI